MTLDIHYRSTLTHCHCCNANIPYYVVMVTTLQYTSVNTAPFEIQYSSFIGWRGQIILSTILLLLLQLSTNVYTITNLVHFDAFLSAFN